MDMPRDYPGYPQQAQVFTPSQEARIREIAREERGRSGNPQADFQRLLNAENPFNPNNAAQQKKAP